MSWCFKFLSFHISIICSTQRKDIILIATSPLSRNNRDTIWVCQHIGMSHPVSTFVNWSYLMRYEDYVSVILPVWRRWEQFNNRSLKQANKIIWLARGSMGLGRKVGQCDNKIVKHRQKINHLTNLALSPVVKISRRDIFCSLHFD